MDEAGKGFLAAGEHIWVARLDLLLHLRIDLAVVQRRAPVGRALEHGEMADASGYGLDGLHARSAGADHGDSFAGEIDGFVRPSRGVEGFPPEAIRAPRCGAGWASTAGRSR